MYAKLRNGVIQYAPSQLNLDGRLFFNPTKDMLKSAGYKEVIELTKPKFKSGYHYISNYIEKEDKIEKVYSLEKDEEINDLETRIAKLEESQEQQNETIDTLLFAEM